MPTAKLYNPQLDQRFFDPVIIDRVRHEIRLPLHGVDGVAHGDAGLGELQHLNVVLPVAEGHGFRAVNVISAQKLRNSVCLSAGAGDDVHGVLVPPCDFAGAQPLRNQTLFFLFHIENGLINLAARVLTHGGYRRGNRALRGRHAFIDKIAVHRVLFDELNRHGFFPERAENAFPVRPGDGLAEKHVFLRVKAELPVECDVSVKIKVIARQHGQLQHMPPCGEDTFYPFFSQPIQRPPCAGRHHFLRV